MKRLIKTILVLIILLCSIAPTNIYASDFSGKCGENVYWELNPWTGVLTISGNGKMTTYESLYDLPWRQHQDDGIIKSVFIENGVLDVNIEAIDVCQQITVADSNPNYCSQDGVLFNKNKTKLLICPRNKQGECLIPNSVTSIDNGAFNNCSGLTDITISDSVTSIGDWAFYNCFRLTDINIPDNVTSIGDRAFSCCSHLSTITIPESVERIGAYAFENSFSRYVTSENTITIPDSVKEIGVGAFGGCNIAIIVSDNNPNYSSQDGVLFDKNKTSLLFCPISKKGTYKVPNSVKTIKESAFASCEQLLSVYAPSVEIIEKCAFHGCRNLNSIDIPNGITSIEYMTYRFCENITSVTIPNAVKSIDDSAFAVCKNLTTITIPNSVKSIGRAAFTDCYNLTDVYYIGTKKEWENISYGEYNDHLKNATIHFAVNVSLNGKEIKFIDQLPLIVNDRTLVPLRAIFEALGATVTWDDKTQTAKAVKGNITVTIKINDNMLYKNGTTIALDVPAQLINNRTMVPVRAISEAFGCSVKWDEETQTVIISE